MPIDETVALDNEASQALTNALLQSIKLPSLFGAGDSDSDSDSDGDAPPQAGSQGTKDQETADSFEHRATNTLQSMGARSDLQRSDALNQDPEHLTTLMRLVTSLPKSS